PFMQHLTTASETIQCPHCQKSFPMTAALEGLVEPLKNKLKKEASEKERTLLKWEDTLKERAAELAQATDDIEQQVAARVQESQAELKQELRKEAHMTSACGERRALSQKTHRITAPHQRPSWNFPAFHSVTIQTRPTKGKL